jgi:hypothetical protein
VEWRPFLDRSPRERPSPSRSPLTAARLLALERENGCVDPPSPAPPPQAWPDWAAAHIAGGDVPPTRVVSDPYPTLHSVTVDAANDRVFMSDPNRHARIPVSGVTGSVPLDSARRVYAQNASGTDTPLRMIRGPKTGLGDPHGVFFGSKNNEIVVANHGNQNGRQTLPGSVTPRRRGEAQGPVVGGRFDEPSMTV